MGGNNTIPFLFQCRSRCDRCHSGKAAWGNLLHLSFWTKFFSSNRISICICTAMLLLKFESVYSLSSLESTLIFTSHWQLLFTQLTFWLYFDSWWFHLDILQLYEWFSVNVRLSGLTKFWYLWWQEWSMGEFKSVYGEMIHPPDLKASYSLELKCSSLNLKQSFSKTQKKISIVDQILIGLVIAVLYHIFKFLWSWLNELGIYGSMIEWIRHIFLHSECHLSVSFDNASILVCLIGILNLFNCLFFSKDLLICCKVGDQWFRECLVNFEKGWLYTFFFFLFFYIY